MFPALVTFPSSFERLLLVSLLILALDTPYRVSLVRSFFIHVSATTQACLAVESRSHLATSLIMKYEECDMLALKCICYCSGSFCS